MTEVQVVPYDDGWPADFVVVERDLRKALGDVHAEAVEHVGSTSIPGLAAKPILDIDIVVRRSALEPASDALVAAGYGPLGDLGITDRHAFVAPDAEPRRHVYVVVEGSLSLRNHLIVRGALRQSAALRAEYGALKVDLAGRVRSMAEYTEAKTELLQRVLRDGGLTQAELAEIERVNRADL
jgi:GrpB-like predicted nucleotidyltransferase (UPF0157 family)